MRTALTMVVEVDHDEPFNVGRLIDAIAGETVYGTKAPVWPVGVVDEVTVTDEDVSERA